MANIKSGPLRGTKRQAAWLQELKELAVKLGFVLREERLTRDASYHVRSGECRLRGRRMILLDRAAPAAAQLDTLVEILAQAPLDGMNLSPEVLALLQGAARRRLLQSGKAA